MNVGAGIRRHLIAGSIMVIVIGGAVSLASASLRVRSATVALDPGSGEVSVAAKCPNGSAVRQAGFANDFDPTLSSGPVVVMLGFEQKGAKLVTTDGNLGTAQGDATAIAYCGKPPKGLKVVTKTKSFSGGLGFVSAEAKCPAGLHVLFGAVEGGERSNFATTAVPTALTSLSPRIIKATASSSGPGIETIAYCANVPAWTTKAVEAAQVDPQSASGPLVATCPKGTTALFGGFVAQEGQNGAAVVPTSLSRPTPREIEVSGANFVDATTPRVLKAIAYCG